MLCSHLWFHCCWKAAPKPWRGEASLWKYQEISIFGIMKARINTSCGSIALSNKKRSGIHDDWSQWRLMGELYEDTFFDELLGKVLNLLRKGADKAVAELRKARQEVDEAEQTPKRARGDFEKAKKELDDAAAEVQRVNDKLSKDLACKKMRLLR